MCHFHNSEKAITVRKAAMLHGRSDLSLSLSTFFPFSILPIGPLPDPQRFVMAIWKPSSASSSACPATSSSSSTPSGRTPSRLSQPGPSRRARTFPWASRAAPRPSSASLRMGLPPSQPRKQHRPRCSPGESGWRDSADSHIRNATFKPGEWVLSLYSSLSCCFCGSNPSCCHRCPHVHTSCRL